ncbi:unnamed protein product [Haemonchus placei]|uniref:Vps8 domain-containing protein n=1 Tax=Haemonchus placei TaxID=6290 RepID=A0A0N4WWX7_HAEPC|nr:unnamed protein product [Haemonchus placei]
MNSVAGSVEAEDWLDISESLSLPSLSLDDVLNEVTLRNLLISNHKATNYSLSDSISHQLVSFRPKNGSAVAVAYSGGYIAVVTSKGSLLLFDAEGRLERFRHGNELDGSASCVAFSDGGGHIAVGYSKGFIINTKSGAVEQVIQEAVQLGRGVLEILYLGSRRTILSLDSGGSVFEINTRHKFRIGGKSRIRCVFSGCNGEVIHMRLLPYSLLALLTVSKCPSLVIIMIFDRKATFGLQDKNGEHKLLRICVGRGSCLSIFRFNPQYIGTKRKAAMFVYKINLAQVCSLLGLTTGGNVSPAMQCLADRACYQALCRKGSPDTLIALSHDELFELTLLSEDDQLELFNSRLYYFRGDFISACYYLFDIHRGRILAEPKFLERLPNLLTEQMKRLVDLAMGGCKEGKVSDLIAHYKTYISILLTVSVGTQLVHFSALIIIGFRVERDMLSRYIFLESLDEFVLDGTLESPPPALVSAYITHLASEGHFSQLQASVVRFPIQSIDLHYVMSTCRQNGLYDGIIYVMNKALGDYLSPLEEMLSDVSSFASNEVLSDSEVERGNRLLLYLHCCLAGHAYPYGLLPPEQLSTVPLQVYRCITSLKGKDGTSSDESYPYLRLLLLFDAQQFTHVIRTCADAPIFQSEGRLQRLVENIGRLSMELRNESALVHFLLLISQLVDISGVITPVEIVEDVVTTLMRMKWQHSSAELAIVETLKAVPPINREAVLRMASSPMRKEICTFIYCDERKFVDLINCYLRDAENEVRIPCLGSAAEFVLKYHSMECCVKVARVEAVLTSTYYGNTMRVFRREKQETFLQMDEDIEEHLFGTVFEGTSEAMLSLEKPFDLLLYWLPTGSRTDFCLNLAAAADCTNTTILLMETRNRLDDAFEILFKQIAESQGDHSADVSVLWLDKGLSFCSRHTSSAHSKEWLIRIMRKVTRAEKEKEIQKCMIFLFADMEIRLQSLASGILENGSEHSLELVECLLDYPAFKNGLFRSALCQL